MRDRKPVWEMDMEKLGNHFIGCLWASRKLGHAYLSGTARDYLSNSVNWPISDELQLVIDALHLPVDDVLSEDELIIMDQSRPWKH